MSRAGLSRVARRLISVALATAWIASARAAPFVDPAYRFRTRSTEHFIICFHQGEESIADALALVAEQTWEALRRTSGTAPPRLTRVVLVDETESAGGWASPLPYDTVVIAPVWPAGSEFIGFTRDWLRLVFAHEFTHIVHLDRSNGWARAARTLLGRHPIVFPNLFLPTWQVEGLATYQESLMTGEGRLYAGDFRAVVNEAARARRLEPLDRVNGGLTDWPGGLAAYAYGLGFTEYLARRFGREAFGALAEETAGNLRRSVAGPCSNRSARWSSIKRCSSNPICRKSRWPTPIARPPPTPRSRTFIPRCDF